MNLQQRLEATVGQAESDAGLLHDIVHGDANTEVQTEGGPVKSVARAIQGVEDDLAASRSELTGQVIEATRQAVLSASTASISSLKAGEAAQTLTDVRALADAATSAVIIPTQTWRANGAQTDFTLDHSVGHPGALQVTVAGVLQTPVEAYGLADVRTLRLVSAPAAGVDITVRLLDKESQTGAASAMEWAIKTSGTVQGGEYSAKYHAQSVVASASTAAQKAVDAAGSATAAASFATTATTKASEAAASATGAAMSQATASTQANAATASAINAATSATAAAGSASTASTKANETATNATASTSSASQSASSASAGSLSASAAASSATSAGTKAADAQVSATAAAGSASAAATSATSAANSLTAVNNVFDTFDDRFLGAKATDPSTDNDGNAILAGAVYYNSASSQVKFYNGAAWESPALSASTSATNAFNSANVSSASATNSASSATASAASAVTAVTKAVEAATSATGAATSAANSASNAVASANAASAAAGSATASAGSALSAAATLTSVQTQAVRAADWAEKTSATVDGTGYSAKHWAGQAAGSAAAVTSNTVIPADVFTATAGQTDFTLSRGIGYPGAILVTVAGVPQAPIDAYTVVNSTTLRFSSGLAAVVGISVRYLDKEAQSGAAVAQEWASKTGGTVSGSTEYSAKTHAQNASASAVTATQRSGDATASASAAAGSASTASTKATEANVSAGNAATSAATATTKASEASTSAANAASSASAAAGSASSASGSASTSATRASEAAGSAATASTRASESSSSASSAEGSASAANTSASQANSSASSASGSASTATSAANNAQTYATQAQAAAASASGSNVAPQVFTGNGSATDFALATASSSVHKLIVSVANVVQDSLDAYLLINSGATLRFSSAPNNGSRIVVRYL